MLLVLDIGNTNIVSALFDEQNKVSVSWRLQTDRHKTKDEYTILMLEAMENHAIEATQIDGVIISSVVPPLNPLFTELFQEQWGILPLVVQKGIKTGINLRIDDPKGLGADRIVNAVAALHIYGGPIITVDLGTATTICAINDKGDFLGGVICPGIGISVEALVDQASQLPRFDIKRPDQAIGKNTTASMQAGIYYGYRGLVDRLVKRFKSEMWEEGQEVKVVATGGFASLIGQDCSEVNYIHPSLTLEGLRILYERNSKVNEKVNEAVRSKKAN
ncbi:type III pantothenate kinase [Heliorestis acidaminivorans]|uniref:Type III pantothenate kinase n=1 Tax=Heliorestis acidaminivorans TaxID=553427 RepID=A0A6I0EZN5_9FIRM|nr:type III pantothenate kinase [Heliorestis acidaminivorans]KAB2952511.1 type III pantothenate kinase [Heliorestis acidaminivorans]